MVGQVVGNYRIAGKIGEGGMGSVFLAEHMLIGRQAALKMLLRELCHNQELVQRFFNEARAATAVRHPGIVEIYDFGYHTDGSAYIVMEYLEGESLASRIRRARILPEIRAAALCRQVAGALGAAHAKGIVHRDLKPDNIFIVPDADIPDGERAKVLDFGVAKLAGEHSGAIKTRTGMIMGTPAYMAPEQCKGAGQVDARADLYALSCILFEMVCGRPPFIAEGAGEVMAQHIYHPVPVPSSVAAVTPKLEQVILRGLAKEPEQRFASSAEFVAALQVAVPSGSYPQGAASKTTVAVPGWAPGREAPAPRTTLSSATGASQPLPLARARGSWVLPVLAAVVLALVGGAAALFASGSDGEPATAALEPAPPEPAPPAPAPKPEPEPPPQPAPEPAPVPPKPARVSIEIASQPDGAEIYRLPQSVRIGKTPMTYTMDAVDGEVVFVLRKRGFRDETIAVPASADATKSVVLARATVARPAGERPAAAAATPPPPAPAPAADKPRSSTLNPFEKPK
jgi:serine/threonine-protein kinase